MFQKLFIFSTYPIINMDNEKIIIQTRKFVQNRLQEKVLDTTGGMLPCLEKFCQKSMIFEDSLYISRCENADLFVTQLAALLHDIADWKFHDGNENIGLHVAREWLEKLHVEEDIISHIIEIVRDISFKGAGVKTPMKTIE